MPHPKLPPEEFYLDSMTILAMTEHPDVLNGLNPQVVQLVHENKIAYNRLMIALAVRAVAK